MEDEEPASSTPVSRDDALIDRHWMAPTAMVQPAGSVTFTNQEIVLSGLTVGIADRAQFTAEVTPFPLPMDRLLMASLSGKIAVRSGRRMNTALFGRWVGITMKDEGWVSLGEGGAVTSLCMFEGCRGVFSISASVVGGRFDPSEGGRNEDPVLTPRMGVGLLLPVRSRVKLVADLEVFPLLEDGMEAGGAVGLRYHTARFSIEALAFFVEEFNRAVGITALPWLGLAHRWR